MSITKSKRQLLKVMTKPIAALNALILVFAFAVNPSAQEVDAQVPVVVNTSASVKIDPPAVGQGTGDEGSVTANTQRPFGIKLVSRPQPEEVLAPASVLHRAQNRAGSGAWLSKSRGNVTLSLQPQQYQNAAISLHSVNGRRILNSKISASNAANSISRSNIPAGVYLLSVKGINGSSFSSRITHSGGRLNINIAFISGTASPLSINSMAAAEPDYGEWTITVSADGHITQSRKWTPTAGDNPLQEFTLTPVVQTTSASFTQTVRINGDSVGVFHMVYIPGGTFTMGCVPGSVTRCPEDAAPVEGVTVSSYFIARTTVTQALWRAVMGTTTGSATSGTWYDAHEFACRLSQLTGRNYRMMTEAEFEYAGKHHRDSLTFGTTEEWAYNTWSATIMGGTDPVGLGSGSHNQKTRRNAQNVGDNITGRLIRSIEGVGPTLRLVLSADTDLPPLYIHPCQLYAPTMGAEPVNSYRDLRWVTGSDARWATTSPAGGSGGTSFRIWADGTATSTSSWGGRETVTNGQWFTSNNISFVFVPTPGQGGFGLTPSITRYAYIFLNDKDGSFITDGMGGAGRIVKEEAPNVAKPAIANLMRGEELARSQPDFETLYKMVDMVNMPQSIRQQDERLLDGPDSGWLQINRTSAHHYRKDVDLDEFRFVVSGGILANGTWFTVNNTFLRITKSGIGQEVCTGFGANRVCRDGDPYEYVTDYLYVVTSGGNFMHNSFMGYERGDFRSFTKMANGSSGITDFWSAGANEIPKDQAASFYRNRDNGQSTFVPAQCPEGGCR
ncbi:MAG: SUMF1/EgtB/PvdO family nonheme iron enzyme [Chitinispirillia bacterium]|nr:SUMF1/EgtB/PvdO family nonheme iron enzyme [Chitinispirillia bacterium]